MLMTIGQEINFSGTSANRGFTLIELGVVVAVIAVFGMLLLPALAKGTAQSHAAICLNNHRQLARACALYARDSNDRLPNNYTVPGTVNAIQTKAFDTWAVNIMTWRVSTEVEDVSNTNLD